MTSIPDVHISDLIGSTLISVVRSDTDEQLTLTTDAGKVYKLWHDQDCCEQVSIEDIAGHLDDLIGSPLIQAEEASQQKDTPDGSETWTFYKFGTAKGYITIRWYGSSNGYYSEAVDFVDITP